MAKNPRKTNNHHSLPEIKVDVKTPPSSGGLMNWGPLFGWLKALFVKRHHSE